MHIIGDRNELILTDHTAILIIRNSVITLIGFCILFVISLVGFFAGLDFLLNKSIIEGFSMILLFVGLMLMALYELGFKEKTEIDLKQGMCIAQNFFMCVCQQRIVFHFPESYEFYYENSYDEESNAVSNVYLIVCDVAKEKTDQKVMCFYSEELFMKFLIVFNEHFPDHKIR